MAADRSASPAALVRLGALLLLTALVFSPVLRSGFVNFDDDTYVTANPHVRAGLDWEGFSWAWSSVGYAGNWHPLTWLSHQLDVELFGLDPAGHHLTSLLFHLCNTALLALLLGRLTGSPGRSILVAALFAVHPLHVESVAWVSERKDVLSAFFGLLALSAYLRSLRRPRSWRMLPVAALFCAGLTAKPMLVTLPLVLLILDFWPLGRLRAAREFLPLVREKVPLLLLAAGSAGITYLAQQRGGAIGMAGTAHLAMRLGNAATAYAAYLKKTVWPFGLSVFYPYLPSGFRSGTVIAALLLLLALSVAALLRVRRSPALAAGWLWFLVALLPVIGLVQAGLQSMADRYTYLTLLGLFVMLAWGFAGRFAQRHRRSLAVAAVVWVGLLSARAFDQALVWRTSETLFGHALTVTPENPIALNNLGSFLFDQGREHEAIEYFRKAARLGPADFPPVFNLGRALARTGELGQALPLLRRALALAGDAERVRAAYVLGGALLEAGRNAEAADQLLFVLRHRPEHAEAHLRLGLALERLGRHAEAGTHLAEAGRLDPRRREPRSSVEPGRP